MSLTLIIALNAVLDLGIIAIVALVMRTPFVMDRGRELTDRQQPNAVEARRPPIR